MSLARFVRPNQFLGARVYSGARLYTTEPRHSAAPPQGTAPTAPRARRGRPMLWLLGGATTAASFYVLGAKCPPPAIPFLFSPYSTQAGRLSDEDAQAHCAAIERAMQELPTVQEHIPRSYETPSATQMREKNGITYKTPLASQETADYVISRPFVNAAPGSLQAQFTAGSLRGAHMIATFPMVFSKTAHGTKTGGGNEGDGFVVVHLGKNLCGYEGVVHGGMIATVFDEALARNAFYGLPNNIGVTGKLELRYRKPVVADRFYIVETQIAERVGRKCFVNGALLDPETRTVHAEASGVFIEPRWAKYASWVGGVNVRKRLES